jgi:hypothetical protein
MWNRDPVSLGLLLIWNRDPVSLGLLLMRNRDPVSLGPLLMWNQGATQRREAPLQQVVRQQLRCLGSDLKVLDYY